MLHPIMLHPIMLQGPHNVTSFQIANCNIMGSGTVYNTVVETSLFDSELHLFV